MHTHKGDDKCVAEAKEIMPWIEAVETKQSFAYTRILSKHPKAVVKEIYKGVQNAVKLVDMNREFFDFQMLIQEQKR